MNEYDPEDDVEENLPYEIDTDTDNEIEEDEHSSTDLNDLKDIPENKTIKINNKKPLNLMKKIDKIMLDHQLEMDYIHQLEREIYDDFNAMKQGTLAKDIIPKPVFINDDNFYRNIVFNGSFDDVKNIKIDLELINSTIKNKMDIWNFFRYYVSSMKKTCLVGLQLYYLVKDKNTDKYLGIISLSSDFNNIKDRDDFIGWSASAKKSNLRYLMNISTCIPLQPFGYNFAAGKLLTMLAFSKEVSKDFINKVSMAKENPRTYPILGITTTSLYGKSIQYDRLKCLKHLGYTKGWSSLPIPDSIYKKCKELCVLRGIEIEKNTHRRSKISILASAFPQSGIKKTELMNKDYQRGIYFGYLYPQSKALLCNDKIKDNEIMVKINIEALSSIDDIFNEWLNKYATKRYEHLKSKKRLKKQVNFALSKKDKDIVYQDNRRKKMIAQMGLEVLQRENPEIDTKTETGIESFNTTRINDAGLLEIRKKDRELYRINKKYTKQKFSDKYDLNILSDSKFPRKRELEKYIPKIIEIVGKNPDISNTEISTELGISYDSLRTILTKSKT